MKNNMIKKCLLFSKQFNLHFWFKILENTLVYALTTKVKVLLLFYLRISQKMRL